MARFDERLGAETSELTAMTGSLHMANHPAAGKAGIAFLFAIVHHRPGLPERVRSAEYDPRFQAS